MDIDEVMQINDEDHSITISMYLNVDWQEPRLKMLPSFGASSRSKNSGKSGPVPTNVELIEDLWLPNIFIYNLKTFKVIEVLSKLSGLWIDSEKNVLYSQATQITIMCPMRFDKFPFDTQTCKFRVGSYSYDSSKLLFITKNTGRKNKVAALLVDAPKARLVQSIQKWRRSAMCAIECYEALEFCEKQQCSQPDKFCIEGHFQMH